MVSFFSASTCKKDTIFDAARKVFGSFYFVTAFVNSAALAIFYFPKCFLVAENYALIEFGIKSVRFQNSVCTIFV